MKFYIDYNLTKIGQTVVYRKSEYSLDTICDATSNTREIDFDISINMLTLTVIDEKVLLLRGMFGWSNGLKTSYDIPTYKKGALKVMSPSDYIDIPGSIGLSDIDWPIYVNHDTKWICIGNPQKRFEAVEFINNCVAVVDENHTLVALWLRPDITNDI